MEISALHCTVVSSKMSVIIEFLIWHFLYISNLFHSHKRPLLCTDFLRPLIVSRHGLVEEQLENELATKLYLRFLFIFVPQKSCQHYEGYRIILQGKVRQMINFFFFH